MNAIEQPGVEKNGKKTSRMRIATVVVLAVAVALAAWLAIDRRGGGSSADAPTTTQLTSTIGPLIASPAVLSALAANVGHDVYWAGKVQGRNLEYLKTANGSVYVRYLTQGVKAGDSRADWMVVATYPFPKAFEALTKLGQGNEVKIPGGGIAVVDSKHPESVHFAFPGVAFQGEVYDPSPAKALEVATSGAVGVIP
jgi:hypothetical protein